MVESPNLKIIKPVIMNNYSGGKADDHNRFSLNSYNYRCEEVITLHLSMSLYQINYTCVHSGWADVTTRMCQHSKSGAAIISNV